MDENDKFEDPPYTRPWIARVGVLLALIAIGFFLPLAASASGTGLRAGALAFAAIFLVIAAPSIYAGRKRGGSVGDAAKNGLRWFAITVFALMTLCPIVCLILSALGIPWFGWFIQFP